VQSSPAKARADVAAGNPPSRRQPAPRRYLAALVAGVILVVLLIPSSRIRVLRGAGSLLVYQDPLAPADVIVVTMDAREAGVLEAADLVQHGMASRVALLAEPATPGEREFVRRGVAYEDAATASARYLTSLGVSEVERIPAAVDGTEAEGRVLRDWCLRRQFRSIIVVSTSDHSRRLRRVLQRSLHDAPARALVRVSRFSQFDPDAWWLTRTGVRTQIIETQKLLLDLARHPFS
jgi:hypothetical protein